MPKGPKSKLWRNLKPGDKFVIVNATGPKEYRAIVTVTTVHETSLGWFSGRRQWVVHGNYPWWWTNPITAYSDERTELVTEV